MNCPNCGTDDAGETGYCKNCGRAVALKTGMTPSLMVGQVLTALLLGLVCGLPVAAGLLGLAVGIASTIHSQGDTVAWVVIGGIQLIVLVLLLGTKKGRSLGLFLTTFIVTTLVVSLGALSICQMILSGSSH